MSDLRNRLDARASTVQAAPDAFQRVLRRVRRRHRVRRLGAAVLSLGLFIGAGLIVWTAFSPGTKRRPLSPGELAITATIPVHQAVSSVAAGEGFVWAGGDRGLTKIDPRLNSVIATRRL